MDIDNFVEEESTTTGTGDITLAAIDGAREFSQAFSTGGTDVFYYAIYHPNQPSEYEFGTGHLSDTTTLVRDTVLDSSNSDNLVDFSSGTKKVICDVPAERVVEKNRLKKYLQPDGLVIANNSTNPNTDIDVSVGGNVWVHDPADESTGIVVDASVASPAVQLDTSGVGGRLNSTLDTNQWYEPGVIASADGELVDYVAWKPANRPTSSGDLPTNYDYFRAMGTPGKTWWVRTDGSSNILGFDHTSDGYYQWGPSSISSFSFLLQETTGLNGTTFTVDISFQAPPTKTHVSSLSIGGSHNGSGGGANLYWGPNNETSGDNFPQKVRIINADPDEKQDFSHPKVRGVTNQQVFVRTSGPNIDEVLLRSLYLFKAVN